MSTQNLTAQGATIQQSTAAQTAGLYSANVINSTNIDNSGTSASKDKALGDSETRDGHVRKLAQAGLLAALCYVGYAVFPAISASGTKIHIGNAFVVLAAYLTGGVYGGLAGAVGLSAADILGGYAASAPRTFICKLVIGLIVGLISHKVAGISKEHEPAYVLRWSAIAAVAGLGFNCFFEPALKYVWYTVLFVNPDKAASAIKALLAITTYATVINAVINSVIAVVLYNALRPALIRAGLLQRIS